MLLFDSSVILAEKRLNDRNRDVSLSAGRQHAERRVERESERINNAGNEIWRGILRFNAS